MDKEKELTQKKKYYTELEEELDRICEKQAKLEDEIEQLEEEMYEDKLNNKQEALNEYKKDRTLTYNADFSLTEDERWEIQFYMDHLAKYSGAIGGQFKVEFITTSIGTIVNLVNLGTGDIFGIRELS